MDVEKYTGRSSADLFSSAKAWFNPSNYDCCSQWGPREWGRAISIRLSGRLPGRRPTDYEDILFKWPSAESKKLEEITPTYNDVVTAPFCTLRIGHLAAFDESEIDYIAKAAKDVVNDESLVGAALDKVCAQEIDSMGFVALRSSTMAVIDLTLPDAILSEKFLQFVHERRKALQIEAFPKVPKDSHFKLWCKHRILGYFDLTWYGGGELTNEQIGTILFPDEFEISLADKIRKVVRPLADSVFRGSTVRALLAGENGADYY